LQAKGYEPRVWFDEIFVDGARYETSEELYQWQESLIEGYKTEPITIKFDKQTWLATIV